MEQKLKDRGRKYADSYGTRKRDDHDKTDRWIDLWFHAPHIPTCKRTGQTRNTGCCHGGRYGDWHIDEQLILTGINAPPGIHLVFRVSLQQYDILKYTLIQDRTDIVDRSAQKHRNDRKKKRPENMRIRFRSRSAFSAHLPFKHRPVYKKQEYQKQ